MANIKKILDFLRDKDFTEEELEYHLADMLVEAKEDAANQAVYQFTTKRREFIEKRNARLATECKDFVIEELNEERKLIKFKRAQDTYKNNRAEKKKLQRNGIPRQI